MRLSLSDMFEQSESDAIEWRGSVVRAVVRLPVSDGQTIRLRRLDSSRERAQALKLGLNAGALEINGASSQTLAIWSHTAPIEVEIRVQGRRASNIDLWNAWSLDGVDNAWLGNSGIVIQDHAGGHTLQCSDGVGEPEFSDLIMWVGID